MKIRAFTHGPMVPELRPARSRRDWMDAFPERHAYRCLPLAIANSFGWEVLAPCDLRIDYDGGYGADAIRLSAEDGYPLVDHFAMSNFTRGVLTLHTGYIFRTEPGWALLATGPINEPKSFMSPFTGIVETDWLPYPFTMNWQLMRPGSFRINKGDPFCHVVPIMLDPVSEAEVEIVDGREEPGLIEAMQGFAARRGTLMAKFDDPEADRESWGREYFRGALADGTVAPKHVHKLRLADPVDRRSEEQRTPPALAPTGSVVTSSLKVGAPRPGGGFTVERKPEED
jgi:uncharacterized protein DUF6065